jgi:hypothetical protein
LISTPARKFTEHEVWLAIILAGAIECSFFALLIMAGASSGKVRALAPPAPSEIPIAVKPVLDDVPLLKLGGKKMRPKLPELWKKNPPIQRFEATSAPSPLAPMTPDAIPSSRLAPKDAGPPPPPDAAIAKQVDQVLLDAGPPPKDTQQAQGEGVQDGVKEGTETDPLKGRAISQYTQLVVAWFNAKWHPPDLPCDVMKGLKAAGMPTWGPDRTVLSINPVRMSGNSAFDEAVKNTWASIVGQQIPPPPPLYSDISPNQFGAIIFTSGTKCK